MDKCENEFHRKIWLLISLMMNIGLLFYFKYSNFFIENINMLLAIGGKSEISWLKLALPIGISFYTFESITYLVDVYRKVHKPLQHFWLYQLYIILFPKLIAGPIIPYHTISSQIENREETMSLRLHGLYRFVLGLGKKVWIANVMAGYVFDIYSHSPDKISMLGAWIGALAYTFQLYFDFSGYSDMAIGLGMLMGFRFPENFNNPYIAESITDFWRRWHISLGVWMRNYLYIPLGGNQVSPPVRVYLNLLIVFVLSGLWHGAAWSFLIWGLYHGIFLVLEKAWFLAILKKLPKILRISYAFLTVMVGCVIFYREDIFTTFQFLRLMVVGNSAEGYHTPIDFMLLFYFGLAFLFSFWAAFPKGKNIQDFLFSENFGLKEHYIASFLSFVLLVMSFAKIIGSDFNPFIYFRF